MTNTNKTSEIKIDDFIEVPVWNVVGCVFAIHNAIMGDESAVCVEIQTYPCSDETKMFRLEDGQFNWA